MKKFLSSALCCLSFAGLSISPFWSNVSANPPEQQTNLRQPLRQPSYQDLQRRVWQLERAVLQLQQQVFQANIIPIVPNDPDWSCTIRSEGEMYIGIGTTEPLARADAFDQCKEAHKGKTKTCKSIQCNQ